MKGEEQVFALVTFVLGLILFRIPTWVRGQNSVFYHDELSTRIPLIEQRRLIGTLVFVPVPSLLLTDFRSILRQVTFPILLEGFSNFERTRIQKRTLIYEGSLS